LVTVPLVSWKSITTRPTVESNWKLGLTNSGIGFAAGVWAGALFRAGAVMSPDLPGGRPGWIDNIFDMADSYVKSRARLRCPSFYRQRLNMWLTTDIIFPDNYLPLPGSTVAGFWRHAGSGYRGSRQTERTGEHLHDHR
jgi:hypothetical protein